MLAPGHALESDHGPGSAPEEPANVGISLGISQKLKAKVK